MKILLGCISIDELGGSQVYHYELVKGLHEQGIDVTLCTFREHNPNGEIATRLRKLNIPHINCSQLNPHDNYDLIVVSQPQTTRYLMQLYQNVPIINIIHSEIRDEDPILDNRISHYIAIRTPILGLLTDDYGISKDKVSLIYNPIDRSRFKPSNEKSDDKVKGIFVGEVLDNIRFPAVSHLVQNSIENNWELYLMSDSKYDFNHPNIKYISRRWDTETVLQSMNFTAGILLGRTTLEGLCCGLPGYTYLIDVHGNITNIELLYPGELENLCDSKFVISQHINLYKKVINNESIEF